MGLAKTFGWDGVHDFIEPRRNALMGLSAGLLSGDLGNAPRYAMQGMQADQEQAALQKAETERQAQINQTAQWLQQNYPQFSSLPPEQGFKLAMELISQQQKGVSPTSDIQNYEYGLQNPGFTDYQTQKGGAAETSLTPTWGIDPETGQPVLGQLNKAGVFVKTDMGGVQPMDPRTLYQERAGGTTMGKEQSAVAASLPGLEMNVSIAKDALNRIRSNAQGLQEHFSQVGALPRDMYVMPGSALGNLKGDLDQALGQSFMQARQALKGGGQITDFEGNKAEQAYTRMRKAYDIGDAKAFGEAMDEFEYYLEQGFVKMKAFAEGSYKPGGASQGGGNQTSTGVQWSIEP